LVTRCDQRFGAAFRVVFLADTRRADARREDAGLLRGTIINSVRFNPEPAPRRSVPQFGNPIGNAWVGGALEIAWQALDLPLIARKHPEIPLPGCFGIGPIE
jgi:hypothetical protein